jgi:hypothetical protein
VLLAVQATLKAPVLSVTPEPMVAAPASVMSMEELGLKPTPLTVTDVPEGPLLGVKVTLLVMVYAADATLASPPTDEAMVTV